MNAISFWTWTGRLAVLVCAAALPAFGQKARAPMVQVQKFSVEQGLSDRNVNVFAKDRQGFLWIGTFNGLNRFDGYDFLNYDARPRNKHKIRRTKIFAIVPDRTGNLLITYEEAGLGAMDLLNPLTGQVEPFEFGPENGFSGAYRAYFQADDGAVYFLATQGKRTAVYVFDEKTQRFPRVFEAANIEPDPNYIACFLRSTDGTFWLAIRNMEQKIKVIQMDATGQILRSYGMGDLGLNSEVIPDAAALTETNGGNILVTLSMHGVFVIKPSEPSGITRHPLLPPNGYLFAKDKRGNLLAYQTQPADPSKGCYLITASGQLVDYGWVFEHQSVIDQVHSDDFTQGLMAGSGDGFNNYQLRPERFKTFLNKELGDEPYGISIRGIVRLGSEKLYISTERNGLYELDTKTNTLTRTGDLSPQLALLNQFLYPKQLLAQGDSVLWITGVGGVLKYAPETGSLRFFKTSPQKQLSGNDEVWGIGLGKNNALWVAARDGRLLQMNPNTGETSLYRDQDGGQPLARAHPSFVWCSNDGMVWVGTTVGGLFCIDPQRQQSKRYSADPGDTSGFDSNHITCIHEDKSGLLWVGTMESGLHVFDPKTGRVTAIYSKENGLLNNSTVGLLPDDKGNFWVSTFIGLSYFDTKLKTFQNYTTTDGLSHNEFNRFSYFFDRQHGRFYFGGMNGVNAFDQKDPRMEANDAPLLVTELAISGQKGSMVMQQEGIVDGTAITLEPGSRFLRLRLALGTFYHPGGNQFSYKLEGLDEDWNYLGVNRDLRLDNLPTGMHALRLRGADSRGNWSRREITLYLIVQEVWYKRWWAYLLYAVFAGTAGFYFYRFQLRRNLAEKETQRLQQLDAFKTRFFTNISHEFRTPLTVILGMVAPLKKHFAQGANAEHDQAAELIRRNSRQLLNLVNQLLDLSRLESGRMELSRSDGDLTAFLRYQVESVHSFAQTRGIHLYFESAVPELRMAFDHEKVQTILINLLSNAVKCTPDGGKVSVNVRRVSDPTPAEFQTLPTLTDVGGSIKIQVSDTGIGIPAEHLSRIFDRFYQVDDSSTRKSEGTGIGLALVQELVKLMQGTITVESTPGQGTTFFVTLPYAPPISEQKGKTPWVPEPTDVGFADENASPSPAAALSEADIIHHSSFSINNSSLPLLLIVEDNPDVRFYIAECVREEYRVIMAENGNTGIQKAVEQVPDIIISDVMMPEKDGFDLCEALKNDERTSHIPIVLLTARADVESRIAGLRRGADDYLAKPFEPVELMIRLGNLVQVRRRLQQRYASLPQLPVASEDPELVLEDAFLIKVRAVIEAHLSEADFEMPQLERAMGMSYSQLFRKVKALTGAPPIAIIRAARLHKAREMLISSTLTIAEIAYEVGFTTPAYFSTSFLEKYGVSPSDFRRSQQ
ncbi:MAG: ATP-binding protein [Saprospiraceae bacterium]